MVSRRRALRALAAGVLAGLAGGRGGIAAATGQGEGSLSVSPTALRYDEPLDVRVTGLAAGTPVTLAARTPDREGRTWASFARFEADERGTVDLARDAPVGGTYHGRAPMGLVWSMRPATGDPPIYVPTRGTTDLTITARAGGRRVGRRTVTRRFGPADVTVREPPEGLVGTAFRPAGDGPYPGVITLHGSGGRPDVGTALMLAARGYAAFAPRYFGPPDPLPDRLAEVPLEYLDRCRGWLTGLPAVRDGPVGLVGSSKGAELALLGGATFGWAGAVAAYAPSGLVWAGLTFGRERTSSWTLGGDPVPYLPTAFPPSVVADYATAWPLGGTVSLRPTYEVPLREAGDDRIAAATIPVEAIDGPVTFVSGGSDRLWPAVRLAGRAATRLREHDHAHAVRHLSFADAGHLISFPHQPTTGFGSIPGLLPGTATALGGTPAGLARAAGESWPAVLATLEEGLA